MRVKQTLTATALEQVFGQGCIASKQGSCITDFNQGITTTTDARLALIEGLLSLCQWCKNIPPTFQKLQGHFSRYKFKTVLGHHWYCSTVGLWGK